MNIFNHMDKNSLKTTTVSPCLKSGVQFYFSDKTSSSRMVLQFDRFQDREREVFVGVSFISSCYSTLPSQETSGSVL